jgi:nucleotide-binding universal stress UspA family protein
MIRVRNVLCPLDFSSETLPEIELGVEICRHFDARLVLEHNFDPRPPNFLSVSWMWSEEKEESELEKQEVAQRQLKEVFGKIPAGIRFEGKLTRGPVDEALLLLAKQIPADLMIMASHGPSTSEHQSVTERIIVDAPCPVLTIPSGGQPRKLLEGDPGEDGLPVVVPVDFSEHSLAGLHQAFDLAQHLPFHLHLFYVEPQSGETAQVEADLKRLRGLVPEWLRDRVETHVSTGEPRKEIVALADREGAVAIVMGTHPKGGLRRLLGGSHCRELLHASHCPVWFVPVAAAREAEATS